MTAWLLALGLAAGAATLEEGERCIEGYDLPCAQGVVDTLGLAGASDARSLALAAQTAFHAGRFADAATLLRKAVDAGWVPTWTADRDPGQAKAAAQRELSLYDQTAATHAEFAEARRGHLVIRYRPGVDQILIDDAFEALERAERNITPLLGGPPPGDVAIEIYPDGRSFIACSSLPASAVRTTGVVALSKWSRLLVTSPRALARGYGWQDTIAHEYIHLVVAYRTGNEAPVWMQEAIAKYLDNRWHDGKDHWKLSPRDESLIAGARAKDDFVSFEEMHPSLALLPTPERAALAYAQLASLMAYSFEKGGETVLARTLPLVRDGIDSQQALARAVGARGPDALTSDWKRWLSAKSLEGEALAELPTVLDGGDEIELDPVLHDREDLARFLRLGDLLRERERPRAALVEYAKAAPAGSPRSPLLANRVAQAHLDLGELAEARAALRESLEQYPEFPLSHKTLGAIERARGDTKAALAAYREAARYNPFDPEVQAAIAALAEATGEVQLAERHRRYLKILRRAGT